MAAWTLIQDKSDCSDYKSIYFIFFLFQVWTSLYVRRGEFYQRVCHLEFLGRKGEGGKGGPPAPPFTYHILHSHTFSHTHTHRPHHPLLHFFYFQFVYFQSSPHFYTVHLLNLVRHFTPPSFSEFWSHTFIQNTQSLQREISISLVPCPLSMFLLCAWWVFLTKPCITPFIGVWDSSTLAGE